MSFSHQERLARIRVRDQGMESSYGYAESDVSDDNKVVVGEKNKPDTDTDVPAYDSVYVDPSDNSVAW